MSIQTRTYIHTFACLHIHIDTYIFIAVYLYMNIGNYSSSYSSVICENILFEKLTEFIKKCQDNFPLFLQHQLLSEKHWKALCGRK